MIIRKNNVHHSLCLDCFYFFSVWESKLKPRKGQTGKHHSRWLLYRTATHCSGQSTLSQSLYVDTYRLNLTTQLSNGSQEPTFKGQTKCSTPTETCLFSCLSPSVTRNLCYLTPLSTIHDGKKLNKLVGEVSTTLNTVLPNIWAMTLLWLPPSPQWALITVALYRLMKQEWHCDTVGHSYPNAPSLSAVWPAYHLKI